MSARALKQVGESFDRIVQVESKVSSIEDTLARLASVVDETWEGMMEIKEAVAKMPKA